MPEVKRHVLLEGIGLNRHFSHLEDHVHKGPTNSCTSFSKRLAARVNTGTQVSDYKEEE